MTAVELGHVKPLCRCGHTWRAHTYNQGNVCDCADCTGYEAAQDWPAAISKTETVRAVSPRPVVAQLLADVAAGLRVLRLAGVVITDEQIAERANNIVAGIVGNYRIEEN